MLGVLALDTGGVGVLRLDHRLMAGKPPASGGDASGAGGWMGCERGRHAVLGFGPRDVPDRSTAAQADAAVYAKQRAFACTAGEGPPAGRGMGIFDHRVR
jgi:hypothetical protein